MSFWARLRYSPPLLRMLSVRERAGSREQGDINYFVRPTPSDLQRFLDYHPQQNPALQEVLICKDGISRKWLTYCERRQALFCFVCMAFGKTDNSIFITGMSDWWHVHQRIDEPEKSIAHQTYAEDFSLRCSNADVSSIVRCLLIGNKWERGARYWSVFSMCWKCLGRWGWAIGIWRMKQHPHTIRDAGFWTERW